MQDTEAVVTILSYCFISALCLVVFFLVDNASASGPWPTKRTKRTQRLVGAKKSSRDSPSPGHLLSANSSRCVSPAPSLRSSGHVSEATSSTSSLASSLLGSGNFERGNAEQQSLVSKGFSRTKPRKMQRRDDYDDASEDESDKAFRRRLKKIVRQCNPPQV